MKRIVSLFVASIIYICMANAQVDNTLQFVDEGGSVVSDGSTINGKLEYVDLGDYGSCYQISTGLSVKNNAAAETGVGVEFTINYIDNGSINCCFPMNCINAAAPGTYESSNDYLTENEVKPFVTEWIPAAYGKCSATFKLKVMEIKEEEIFGETIRTYAFKAYGPSVTVNFSYDESSGINDVTENNGNKVVAYYSLDGKPISKPQKGINVVKYLNGKTAKIIVK